MSTFNVICDNCNKKFYKKPNRIKKDKINTCSFKCHGEYAHKQKVLEIEKKFNLPIDVLLKKLYIEKKLTTRKIEKIIGLSYKKVGEWLKKYNISVRHGSEAVKTQWINNDTRRKQVRKLAINILNSKENREKLKLIQQTKEYKIKSRNSKLKELNPNWNPNLTNEERIKNRNTEENEIWRNNIYKKYNYTCAICGDNKGGNLNAHHLNAYAAFPNERFDANNGICLCETCHIRFHNKYGYGNNTKEQFKEWEKSFID